MISNYTELQSAVTSWLDRQDLADKIPDFIELAESAINAELRLREMVKVGTIAFNATIPADWLSFTFVSFNGKQLEYATPEQVRALQKQESPTAYSIEGDLLLLNSEVAVDVGYYARIPALSVQATNPVLVKFPQLYLCKALSWANAYLMDEAKAQQWEIAYQDALRLARSNNGSALISGSLLRIKTR